MRIMYSMADSLPPNNTIDLTKPQLITKDVIDSLRDSLNNDMFGSNEDKTDYSIVSKKKIADTAKNLVTNYLPLSLLKKSGNEDNEKAIKARIEQQIAKLKKDGKYDTNYNYDTQEYNGKKLRYLGKCESIKLIRDGNDLNSNQNYQNDNNDIPEDKDIFDSSKFFIRLNFIYWIPGAGVDPIKQEETYPIEILNKEAFNKLLYDNRHQEFKITDFNFKNVESINYNVITDVEIMKSPKPLPNPLPIIPNKKKGGKRRTKKASKRSTKKRVQKRVRRTRR